MSFRHSPLIFAIMAAGLLLPGCRAIGGCLYKWSENRGFDKVREKSKLHCETVPLHCALRDGNEVEIAEAMGEPGALNARDGWGRTALHWCVSAAAKGPCASEAGRVRVTGRLLAAGANANVRDEEKQSVLFTAIIRGRLEAARILIIRGADVNGFNGDNPEMPQLCNVFWLSGRHGKERNLAALRFLMKQGARMTPECRRRIGLDSRADYLSQEYRRLRDKRQK